MNNVYDYLINEEIFFKKLEEKNEENEILLEDVPKNYEQPIDNETWRYYHCKKSILPNQGWKIHVSSNINELKETFKKVAEVAILNNVSFKVLKNRAIYLASNSKNADRSSSGKYMTLYPVNSGLKMLFYGGLKMSFFSGLRLSHI